MDSEVKAAVAQTHRRALAEAKRFALVRPEEQFLTGAQSTQELLRKQQIHGYMSQNTGSGSHHLFVAQLIDEPLTHRTVDMLQALTEEESLFYKEEDNVLEMEGKSQVIMEELESQYASWEDRRASGPPTFVARTCLP